MAALSERSGVLGRIACALRRPPIPLTVAAVSELAGGEQGEGAVGLELPGGSASGARPSSGARGCASSRAVLVPVAFDD